MRYHQATFDLLGKKPRPSTRAVAALERRERVLGITLPDSLREFYSVQGGCTILTEHSNADEAVPIERIGDREALAHGFLKIQDENQGVAAWYVRLDGSDDPPVEVECEGYRRVASEGVDGPSFWDVAVFQRVADRFSTFVYDRVQAYGGGRKDREAAASLRRYGASVEFDGRGRAVRVRVETRPHGRRDKARARPFDAVAVMMLVRKLEGLEALEIYSGKVGAGGWAVIRDHPGIVSIQDLGSLDDAASKHVVALPALRNLSVFNDRLTDAGLARLLQGHPFAALSIGVGKKLTARGLAALADQAGLERLTLYGGGKGELADDGIAPLAGLTSLRELEINSARVGDDGLRPVAGLTGLESLWLYLDGITDAALAPLAGLTGLTFLRLRRSIRVSEDGFRHLAGLHNLRELDVRGLPVTDRSLAHLSALDGLEVLDLRETKVVGPGFRCLSGLRKLRHLDCGGNGVTDEGMPHLGRLTSLEQLDLSGATITDAGLLALAPLRSLRDLELTGATVSAQAIRGLKAAIPGLTWVRWTRPGRRLDAGMHFDFRAKPGAE
jgi:hypothetical protein